MRIISRFANRVKENQSVRSYVRSLNTPPVGHHLKRLDKVATAHHEGDFIEDGIIHSHLFRQAGQSIAIAFDLESM
ncbi:MAG TPA: hypothetical protein DIS62_06980 [Candidatus Kerfeldbacteria bacterium]|nr:hypothetical protein [Candidatus Kerfeldbacteria bacterium]